MQLLPVPRGYRPEPCTMCAGNGFVALDATARPRQCPTCRGACVVAITWLSCGGMEQRVRQLGLRA